ncbi:hypothetical protein [Flavobacterium pectinovorum]|uniref:DUF1634 domain-containing protein n=1 Tax=Flavobacterium pectinovorum TaxID=29533 RepID=A0AB36P666_9FLAO|nr:hypothetical protein [Flavobacterium pectinovorum]OXB06479.1 hypothetical protein B0A72_05375 [Flavobacterium pectinovorum]SHL90871.1 hypothetical protein SAMN05444387_1415 [Flavobacterium pectinovorum]
MNFLKNLTPFFIIGMISIIAGLIYATILITGNSAQDGLMGIYILLGLIPLCLFMMLDRFLVKKFGNQKVNKVQFSILLFMLFLWILRLILNML